MKPSPTCEGYRTFWGGVTPTTGFTVLGQERMRDSIQEQAKQQAGFLTKHPDPAPTSSVTTVAVSALSGSRSSLSTGSPASGSKVLGVGKINGVRRPFLFRLSFVGEKSWDTRTVEGEGRDSL